MKLIDLKTNVDARGALTVIEGESDVPFDIKRCYILHHLEAARGGHAQPYTKQLIIAVSGSVRMVLHDGNTPQSFVLETPTTGLSINPMTWIEIAEFSSDAVVCVLASTHYDHKLTIRNWNQFLSIKFGK
jgi:dTDP-4-dehydrorhamnose 3,5-epimerase-like enzyme